MAVGAAPGGALGAFCDPSMALWNVSLAPFMFSFRPGTTSAGAWEPYCGGGEPPPLLEPGLLLPPPQPTASPRHRRLKLPPPLHSSSNSLNDLLSSGRGLTTRPFAVGLAQLVEVLFDTLAVARFVGVVELVLQLPDPLLIPVSALTATGRRIAARVRVRIRAVTVGRREVVSIPPPGVVGLPEFSGTQGQILHKGWGKPRPDLPTVPVP